MASLVFSQISYARSNQRARAELLSAFSENDSRTGVVVKVTFGDDGSEEQNKPEHEQNPEISSSPSKRIAESHKTLSLRK